MTHLSEILDISELKRLVAEKMIDRKESDDGRILYNYTNLCQISRNWNLETRLCRGLVTDDKDNLLARPFPKFWNLEEHANPELPRIPNEPFQATDKLDGSLIIAYRDGFGDIQMNTRGSFVSDQTVAAKEWLKGKGLTLPIVPGTTWLMEWIAPDNKIVVNYGDREELVFLAVIDNRTGKDVYTSVPKFLSFPQLFLDGTSDQSEIDQLPDRDDAEGYVIRFDSGFRVKVKHPRYVQLHKILSGLTEHRIWEILSNGGSLDEILAIVPDETYEWITDVNADLIQRVFLIGIDSHYEFEQLKLRVGTEDRKAFALEAMKSPRRSILFSMLDGKDYSKHIWKMIEPKGNTL